MLFSSDFNFTLYILIHVPVVHVYINNDTLSDHYNILLRITLIDMPIIKCMYSIHKYSIQNIHVSIARFPLITLTYLHSPSLCTFSHDKNVGRFLQITEKSPFYKFIQTNAANRMHLSLLQSQPLSIYVLGECL